MKLGECINGECSCDVGWFGYFCNQSLLLHFFRVLMFFMTDKTPFFLIFKGVFNLAIHFHCGLLHFRDLHIIYHISIYFRGSFLIII